MTTVEQKKDAIKLYNILFEAGMKSPEGGRYALKGNFHAESMDLQRALMKAAQKVTV